MLSRPTLKTTTFPFRKSSPNAKALIMPESVFQALGTNITGETDPLRLTRRAAFLRKEGFGVGLSAESAFLPTEVRVAISIIGNMCKAAHCKISRCRDLAF
jgi:hypothetical protein